MGATAVLLVSVLVIVFGWLYRWMRGRYRYWSDRGVPHQTPLPILGSSLPLVTMSKTKGEIYQQLYNKFKKQPFFGVFDFVKPELVIADPELAGKILVKDFAHFVDHGLSIDEERDWIDASLFNLNGSRWKALRNKTVPAFTTGKLRGMYTTVLECAEAAVRRLEHSIGEDVDVKVAMSTYSTEVVASVAFGLDATKCDARFTEMGSKALKFTPLRYLKFLLLFNFPGLAKIFGASLTSQEVSGYFGKIIGDTLKYRAENNIVRNDFVQLLLQLKEKGKVEVQPREADDAYLEYGEDIPTTETIEITEKLLIAQAYTFMMAGFEAMASSLMFILLELSMKEEIQEKAREEVKRCIRKHGGFTYQALKDMTYLEMCMQESMRVRPLVTFLFRKCSKPYRISESLVLEEGTMVNIPVLGYHKDPDYWPEPEEFRPERFGPEVQRVPFAYLPFGDGPRMCIGMRFAMLQMKQCAASILNNFSFRPSPATKFPIQLNKVTIITVPKYPVWLRFTKLKQDAP